MLATAHADRIGGNLAWIREQLVSHEPAIEVKVLAHRATDGLRGRVRSIVDLLVAGWQLATARVFVVDDYYLPLYAIRPRSATTVVQAWHACGAFKRFGYSVVDKGFGADEAMVAEFPIHTNYDVCLVSSMGVARFYAEAFRQPIERFTSRLGIPRTDLFFDGVRSAAAAAAIRARYRLPEGRRIVLYAPTFRGARTTLARSPEDLDLGALRDAIGSDHLILLRAHPFATAARPGGGARGAGAGQGTPDSGTFAVDVSDYPDLNELMLVSDVLVTDYSSAIYEFALLDRPIAFFAPDHDAYQAERGFYLDWPDDLPGPVFETTDTLAAYLRAGEFDLDRVRRFAAASFDIADGGATRRFIAELVVPALG